MVISCSEIGYKRSSEESIFPSAKRRDEKEEQALETVKKAGLLGIHFFDLARISKLSKPQLSNLERKYPDEIIRRGERRGMFYHKSVEQSVPSDEQVAKFQKECEATAIQQICDEVEKQGIQGVSFEQLQEMLRSHRLPIRYAKSYICCFGGNLIKNDGKYYHKNFAEKLESQVPELESVLVKEIKKSRIEKSAEARKKLIEYLIAKGADGASKEELKKIADLTDTQINNIRFQYLRDQVEVRDSHWYIKTAVEALPPIETRLTSAIAEIEKCDREGIDTDTLLSRVYLNLNELRVLKSDEKVSYIAGRFFPKGKEPVLQKMAPETRKELILAKLREVGAVGIDVKELALCLNIAPKNLHNIKNSLKFLTIQIEGGGPNRSERWFLKSN